MFLIRFTILRNILLEMGMMRVACFAVLSALSVSASFTQSVQTATVAAVARESLGTVAGHVYLAESNAPARFAHIALQPVKVEAPPDHVPGSREINVKIYEAGLEGGYSIPDVPPGTYYVVVSRPGYLSPFSQFTHVQLEKPTPDIQQQIDALLPKVTVLPNATATLDIRLQRGASMSGIVRFDDGTPFPSAYLSLQVKDASGSWVEPTFRAGSETDDEGRWRMTGLLPGDYLLHVNLSLEDRRQDVAIGSPSSVSSRTKYSLNYYKGDTPRESEAKIVTLAAGQDDSSEDITIPVSKLHSVSGSVLDERTGKAVNSGQVLLVYADSGKQVASTDVDYDSRSFRFPFVPEGEYSLRIKDAKEVRREGSVTDDGWSGRPKEKVIAEFAAGEMPLVVQTDTNGVNLSVRAQPKRTNSPGQ